MACESPYSTRASRGTCLHSIRRFLSIGRTATASSYDLVVVRSRVAPGARRTLQHADGDPPDVQRSVVVPALERNFGLASSTCTAFAASVFLVAEPARAVAEGDVCADRHQPVPASVAGGRRQSLRFLLCHLADVLVAFTPASPRACRHCIPVVQDSATRHATGWASHLSAGGRAVCLSLILPLILPVGPVCAARCPGGLTRSGAASGCRCAT